MARQRHQPRICRLMWGAGGYCTSYHHIFANRLFLRLRARTAAAPRGQAPIGPLHRSTSRAAGAVAHFAGAPAPCRRLPGARRRPRPTRSRSHWNTTYSIGIRKMPEQRRGEHAAEHRRADRAPADRAGAARDHQRHEAGDEREAGHHHRPEAQARALDRGIDDRSAALALLLGELDDQDRRSWRRARSGPRGRSGRRHRSSARRRPPRPARRAPPR